MAVRKHQSALRLVDQIEREHAAALASARDAVEHAAKCGRLLRKAQDQVAHGEWLRWIADNLSIGPRQCQKYMQLAAALDQKRLSESHFVSIEEALQHLRREKEPDPTPDPAPLGTIDLGRRRRVEREREMAVERLSRRMDLVAERHGPSAVTSAIAAYNQPDERSEEMRRWGEVRELLPYTLTRPERAMPVAEPKRCPHCGGILP